MKSVSVLLTLCFFIACVVARPSMTQEGREEEREVIATKALQIFIEGKTSDHLSTLPQTWFK